MRIWLMLAPALVVIGGLFGGGLALGVLRSLDYMPVIGLDQPGLTAWARVLADGDTWRALALSLWIALASTLISAIIAVGAALLLRRAFRGRAAVSFLVQLNLTIPHLVGAIGILYLLGQSGSFARLAAATGLIARPADFPAVIWDPAAIGIITAYVWKEVPFITLVTLATLQSVGAEYEAGARTLGARPAQALRHVLWPLIRPGVLAASAIVFAFTLGAYEIPALLGASYPKALPILAWERFTDPDLATRPEAMVLALLIALVSAILIIAALRPLRGMSK